MRYRLTEAAPVAPPVTTDEAKAWLDLAHDADDALVDAALLGLSEVIEEETGLALSSRAFTYEARVLHRRWVTGLMLPRRPVTAITAVTRYTYDGTETALVDGEDYWAEDDHLVFGPAFRHFSPGDRYVVEFTAGYADAAAVPGAVRLALRRSVKDAYAIPGNIVIGLMASRPKGLDVLAPFRRVRV